MEGGKDATAAKAARINSCDRSMLEQRDLVTALENILRDFFQTGDGGVLDAVRNSVEFLDVHSGAALFEQGERNDDVYFVLSGRLRAVRKDRTGKPVTLGEIGRGETVGELALILREPRSASVVALRDSVVARLGASQFEAMLAAEPSLGLRVARVAVERYRRAERVRQPPRKPVVIAVLPIDPRVDAREFTETLAKYRSAYGEPVRIVGSPEMVERFGAAGNQDCGQRHGAVAEWLTEMESSSDALFLVADAEPTAWTHRCVRQADEVLLLAAGDSTPQLSASEQALFDGEGAAPMVFQSLVLLHPHGTISPRGTRHWLDRRPIDRHFHLRQGDEAHFKRLARTLSGRAVGMVCAGGGAFAFVHFGVIPALAEAGIEPDFMAGTSMGATVSAWRAMGLTDKDLVEAGRKVYLSDPTGDLNPLPLLSLILGQRIRRITRQAVVDATGGESIDVEDTWLPYFCVASDLSAADEAVLTRGPLEQALRASFAIPGALPPVIINRHLMVDGGLMNNFPIDVMEKMGAGTIIGINFAEEDPEPISVNELPRNLELLFDRFRPVDRRKYRLPLLPEILLTSTIIASRRRQRLSRERVDLLIEPPVDGIGMLDWKAFDTVIARATEFTRALVADLDPEFLDRLR